MVIVTFYFAEELAEQKGEQCARAPWRDGFWEGWLSGHCTPPARLMSTWGSAEGLMQMSMRCCPPAGESREGRPWSRKAEQIGCIMLAESACPQPEVFTFL